MNSPSALVSARAASSAGVIDGAVVHWVALGLVLPGLFFVNDLGRPFLTGLLLCPFGLGCVAARLSPSRVPRQTISCLLLAAVAYAGIAATSLVNDGLAIRSILAACLLLLGFASAALAFRDRPGSRTLLLPEAGVTLGALILFLLPEITRKTQFGVETAGLFRAGTLAAGACLAGALWSLWRPASGRPLADVERLPRRQASLLFYSASTTLVLAMTTGITLLMMWESFGWAPSKVALSIAIWGGLALPIHQFLQWTVTSSRFLRVIALLGLVITGVGNFGLMCSPNAVSLGILWFSIVLIGVGWGVIRWTRNRCVWPDQHHPSVYRSPRVAEVFVAAMVAVGPLVTLAVFYAHERTSFGLCGVALAGALVDVFRAWRDPWTLRAID